MFEVFSISGHYVLHDGKKSLWCCKLDGKVVPSNSTILDDTLEPVCLGTCHGIVGKIKFLPESPENLVLIADQEFVCNLHGASVYRINDIVMLPLSLETPYLDLPACSNHSKPPKGEDVTETDAKIERKLEEEFIKWFEKSFYYSEDGDITHTLTELSNHPLDSDKPYWQQAKTEYFWNAGMLECLISVYNQFPELCNPWIIPVMQGYIEQTEVESSERSVGMLVQNSLMAGSPSPPPTPGEESATLTIVSRRSKYRAGTRFKRRGIDDDGCPANFVETEQIFAFGDEELSYTIIRGSVPVFWYQPLTNYRPKPVILRSPEEALNAFKVHMDGLIALHQKIVIVNLLDSDGKEAPLGDEYAKVAYMYNNELLTYIAFDFNEYCAGMKFDNVSVLLKELDGITNNFGFTRLVKGEPVQCQEGAIRVNCMDSLDRTNVVQGAIARQSLLNQAMSLNIPAANLSAPGKLLWANNGDAISTQYAGTAALKGDYTRTGERGVAGMMRDGVSSVTRMYINVFRDTNRQAAVDIMQGLEPDLAEIREEWSEELDCVPGLVKKGTELLPTHEDIKNHNIYKSWVTQEWPSGDAKAVWLTPKAISIVHEKDSMDTLPLSTCDRLHIGQPPDCIGHYMRLINGKLSITIRPITLETNQLKDVLMKMAHFIVSYRDDLGLTTQVLHGPLARSDIVDMGFDRIRSSANSFGTKIAAGAKRMIGEARGVLDKSSEDGTGTIAIAGSPRNSPKFGKKMLNMFRREEVLTVVVPPVRLSDLSDRNSISSRIETDSGPPGPESVSGHMSSGNSDSAPNIDQLSVDSDIIVSVTRPLRAACSDSALDKSTGKETLVTFKDRSATFDTLGTLNSSKSHFIFFDRLSDNVDTIS